MANEKTIIESPDIRQDEIQIPDWLPIVPLHNSVLFPGATAPIAVSSEDASRAIETSAKSNRLFAAVAIKNDEEEAESPADLYRIGTAAFILRMMRGAEEMTQLVARGLHKIRIKETKQRKGITWARIEVLYEETEMNNEIEALSRQVAQVAEDLIQKAPGIPNELQGLPSSMQNPNRLAYMVLSLTRADKQRLQEIYQLSSLNDKLLATLKEVNHELEIVELGGKIQNEIQTKMSQTEREYYLREQLRAIRKELGEADDENTEAENIREQLDNKNLPLNVREKAEQELKRFERLPTTSPEYPMVRNYLEWLVDFPWTTATEDKLDIKAAEKVLNEDHYDIKQVKERILEYLAVRKLNPEIKGPILCFVGPPGVGKTSLGQSIARSLGRNFIRMSLGGLHDEAEIRGHRRTYIGALPGAIVQHIKKSGSMNPVFMLDEIDKVGRDFRGDPSSALLEVLDPEQNHTFRDNYMELDIDLSQVLFIATANVPDRIQPPLRDRMEEIRLAGYTTDEKEEIANRYLIPRAVENNGLNKSDLAFGKGALTFLIQSYTREAGVRNLERQINSICRKIAVEKTRGRWKKRKLTQDRIIEFLGPQLFQEEVARRTSRPGVATGLAWTPVGGEILFVEALIIPGGKGLVVTGKLGEVMKESAKAAMSFVRAYRNQLDIPENFFKENEVHLHVPAGAVPKDGPSAGVTMLTAIASAVTDNPVHHDVAMTGEITLSGQVLPIGGVKEKVIAAHRAGIQKVCLPERNRKDVEEIDEKIRKHMHFTFVSTMEEVLQIGLKDGFPPLKKKQKDQRRSSSKKQAAASAK